MSVVPFALEGFAIYAIRGTCEEGVSRNGADTIYRVEGTRSTLIGLI